MSLFARAATHAFYFDDCFFFFSVITHRSIYVVNEVNSFFAKLHKFILMDSVLYEIPRISIPCFKFEHLFEHDTLKAECD